MGRKIKRTKTLYRKRRSKAKTAIGTALFIVFAIVLGVVGFSIANTLFDYLENKKTESDIDTWKPPITEDETTTPIETTAPNTSEPDKGIDTKSSLVFKLSDNALSSEETLKSELDAAKAANAKAVMITFKNDTGGILFKSDKYRAKEERTVTPQTVLTLAQARELEVIALVGTLKDHVSPSLVTNTTYRFADDSYNWLDDAFDRGGKAWLTPFNSATNDYLSGVVEELNSAGIKQIIFKNLIFPAFTSYDLSVLANVTDMTKRADALFATATAISGKADDGMILVKAFDAIGYVDGPQRTAEVLRNQQARIELNFAVEFSKELAGAKIGESQLPDKVTEAIKSSAESMLKLITSDQMTAVIVTEGISEADIAVIEADLKALDVKNIIFR